MVCDLGCTLHLLVSSTAEARCLQIFDCRSVLTSCMLRIPPAGKTHGGNAVELQVKYRNSIRVDTANACRRRAQQRWVSYREPSVCVVRKARSCAAVRGPPVGTALPCSWLLRAYEKLGWRVSSLVWCLAVVHSVRERERQARILAAQRRWFSQWLRILGYWPIPQGFL